MNKLFCIAVIFLISGCVSTEPPEKPVPLDDVCFVFGKDVFGRGKLETWGCL